MALTTSSASIYYQVLLRADASMPTCQCADECWCDACNWCAGTYQFKFIVDNEWRYAADQATVRDEMGNINNCLTVEDQQMYLHEDPCSGFFGNNPTNVYTQTLPDEITLAKEPPVRWCLSGIELILSPDRHRPLAPPLHHRCRHLPSSPCTALHRPAPPCIACISPMPPPPADGLISIGR